jgi:hypothetical protein
MLQWLKGDRFKHWQKKVRDCTDIHTQARLALKRREIFDRALSGSESSAIDERKALQKAERRLREAQRRFQMVKSYIEQMEKLQQDYKAQVKGLMGEVDIALPNARAALDKMIVALEKYIALTPTVRPASETMVDRQAVVNEPGEEARDVLLQRIQMLRKSLLTTAERRRMDRAGDVDLAWLTEGAWGDVLSQLVLMETSASIQGTGDRVVSGVAHTRAEVLCLIRTLPAQGDSGWTVLDVDRHEEDPWQVIRVQDVLDGCSRFTQVLSLPVGYGIWIDQQRGLVAVADPQDRWVWRSDRNEGPVPIAGVSS